MQLDTREHPWKVMDDEVFTGWSFTNAPTAAHTALHIMVLRERKGLVGGRTSIVHPTHGTFRDADMKTVCGIRSQKLGEYGLVENPTYTAWLVEHGKGN